LLRERHGIAVEAVVADVARYPSGEGRGESKDET
jgi:hypothetical protein